MPEPTKSAAQQAAGTLNSDDLSTPPTAPRVQSRDDEDTVVIGCRMPNGLTLRIFEEFEDYEQTQSGVNRIVKRFEPTGEMVVIKGNALDIAKLQNQELPDYQIMNGFALTANVPRAFWELWEKQNHDSPLLRSGLIFAQPTENRARDDAKGRGNKRSGLEPIDPADPSKTVPSRIAARIEKGVRVDA